MELPAESVKGVPDTGVTDTGIGMTWCSASEESGVMSTGVGRAAGPVVGGVTDVGRQAAIETAAVMRAAR
jgi:hypothetical protein